MKRLCWFLLFPVVFFAFFSIDVFSQSNASVKPVTEITVCKIELAEAGRTANFHFNYIYLLTTDGDGVVKRFEQLHQDHPAFVEDEKFADCMKGWKLKPLRHYSVTVSFGTNSTEDFVLITNEEEKIKIIL